MAEYPINKGIGRPVEFKGLKAQYLFIFCGGLLALFVLFVILYMVGIDQWVCIGFDLQGIVGDLQRDVRGVHLRHGGLHAVRPQAERVVSAGKGIGEKKNMKLVESLAKAAGAAIGSSRPVAETLKYLPLNRYVGMSGQKFTGNLYIACGISGASQHLKGIKDASTIVAINKNGNAPIFKNCDYGIVGDVAEILPLLTAALGSGEKLPAPPMVKMKRPTPPKPAPIGDRYVCSGCGYEYVPELGDEDGEIAPGTLFEQLPAEWVCPECAETKDQFVKA